MKGSKMEINNFQAGFMDKKILGNMPRYANAPGAVYLRTLTVMANHVIDDGRPGYDDDHGMCVYRGPEGVKCLIGALIPDDEYNEHCMEDVDAGDASIYKICMDLGYKDMFMNLALQNIHDVQAQRNDVEEWRNSLLYVFASVMYRFCGDTVRESDIYKKVIWEIDETKIDFSFLKQTVQEAIDMASGRIVNLASALGYDKIIKNQHVK